MRGRDAEDVGCVGTTSRGGAVILAREHVVGVVIRLEIYAITVVVTVPGSEHEQRIGTRPT